MGLIYNAHLIHPRPHCTDAGARRKYRAHTHPCDVHKNPNVRAPNKQRTKDPRSGACASRASEFFHIAEGVLENLGEENVHNIEFVLLTIKASALVKS